MSEIIVEIQGRLQPLTEAIVLAEYACVAIATIVFYDYLLTLNLEVRLPTFIFLVNRYSCMAFCIALIYPVGTRADFILQIVFGSLLSISLALFFALRTSAIWDCSYAIFAGVLLAYLPGFTMNLAVSDSFTVIASVPGCFIAFDALVLCLSLARIRRLRGSLGLKDMGAVQMFVLEHGSPTLTCLNRRCSSILVSRFMLHLRDRSTPYVLGPPHSEAERRSLLSRPSVIGNLGELLVTDEDSTSIL
ncbi:hypothetical protein BC629DRAFT_1512043 [Irpex lacteus]|nr:hypothetical protein BC629DRAFT_1512043 [Irpex lacteus]